MEFATELIDILPLLIPVILIDLGMRIYAIVDILKVDRVVKVNKVFWIVIIAIVNFGWLIYLLVGRDE